jgi:hypothetical protein
VRRLRDGEGGGHGGEGVDLSSDRVAWFGSASRIARATRSSASCGWSGWRSRQRVRKASSGWIASGSVGFPAVGVEHLGDRGRVFGDEEAHSSQVGGGPFLERVDEFLGADAQLGFEGGGFAFARGVAVHEGRGRRGAPSVGDELDHPVALGVGLAAVGRLLGSDEGDVDAVEVEECVGLVGAGEEPPGGLVAWGVLAEDGGRLGEPVGDAVAGLAEGDGVGVLVLEDAGPVEGAHGEARAFARALHGDDGAGGGGHGVDAGHAGDADAEPGVGGHDLDEGFLRRFVADAAGDLVGVGADAGVDPLEDGEHLAGEQGVEGGPVVLGRGVADDEVVALGGGEFGEAPDEFEAVAGAGVEGIELDGAGEGAFGLGVAGGLDEDEAQVDVGLDQLGRRSRARSKASMDSSYWRASERTRATV